MIKIKPQSSLLFFHTKPLPRNPYHGARHFSAITAPASNNQLLLLESKRIGTGTGKTRTGIPKRQQSSGVVKRFVASMANTRISEGRSRRFLPLKGDYTGYVEGEGEGGIRLKGVVFDVDGTLCLPQTYMFTEMRAAAQVPPGADILDHVYSLPPPTQQSALSKIRAIELTAMQNQIAQPGVTTLTSYLTSQSLPLAICTRNFITPVNHLLSKFLSDAKFHPIVTRDFRPPKPHPAGILSIAREWGLEDGEGLIMVGDSIDDMEAGFRAGAATVLLVNDVNRHLAEHEYTDLVVERLDELVEVLERGFVARTR